MDWLEVEAKLKERALDVAQHLLPSGKREAGEWICGNLDGQKGRSLKVNLAGKVGVWCDFAGDGGGKTLMSLWCSVRQQPFRVCIKEAKDFLGIRDGWQNPNAGNHPGPVPVKPDESSWRKVSESWAKCGPLVEGGPVWLYLVEQRRLDPQVVALYDIREIITYGEWVMVFPYWPAPLEEFASVDVGQAPLPDWLKFEKLARVDGKKKEWTSPQPQKSLFGVQLSRHPAFNKCRDVLICEGEKDAVTWAGYGCAARGLLPVSVPFGAKWKGQHKDMPSPNREWLDRNWDWLQGFETVYVAMDGDESGKRAAADIILEIGPRRCRLVELMEKGKTEL
jgi:twinkle protein